MYWFLHSMNWNSWGSVLSCVLGTVALVYLFERFEYTGEGGIDILTGDTLSTLFHVQDLTVQLRSH